MQTAMTTIDDNQLDKPKHPGGRPSKYNTRTVRRVKEYITSEVDKVPTMAGLARYLNVTRAAIYEWLKDESKQELIDTVSMMTDERERKLINQGLDGKFNSNIAKLILTTNHGYSENNQRDTGITVNVNRSAAITHDGNTLTVDVEG